YLMAAPGTRIGFGTPELATGGLKSGVSAKVEAGALVLYTHDANGAETLLATVTSAGIELAEGKNLQFGTTTGSQIGTDPLELIGKWGSTPVAQSTGWSTTGGTPSKTHDAATPTTQSNANS
ncbi:MAG: hypothetical protein ACPGVG_16445, partial [Mycobacterium sp.]